MHKSMSFYRDEMLITEIGITSKQFLRAGGAILGQSDSSSSTWHLSNCDSATTLLGFPSVPSRCRYLAYGFREVNANLPVLGFTGQRLDNFTGYYPLGNGHRFYSPFLMRFIQADALSPFSEGGINPYAYCANDPINRHDPSGRLFEWLRRGVSRLNRWLSPPTSPSDRRISLSRSEISIDIEPQLPQVTEALRETLINATADIIFDTVADVVRPVIAARELIGERWNALPQQVRSAAIVVTLGTFTPSVGLAVLAAVRTGTFLPLSPIEGYRLLFSEPTAAQRSALGMRRNSF